MNPYKALHDVLEALPDKRLGVGFLCSCAMGKIVPEELRKYSRSAYERGGTFFWRAEGFDSVLTPLGFTPEIAHEIEMVNDNPGAPWEEPAERYLRVLNYLKEKINESVSDPA